MQPFSFDGTERMRDRRGDREQAAEQVDAQRSRLLREHSRMRSCTVYFIQCTVQRELENKPQRREWNGYRCDVVWSVEQLELGAKTVFLREPDIPPRVVTNSAQLRCSYNKHAVF